MEKNNYLDSKSVVVDLSFLKFTSPAAETNHSLAITFLPVCPPAHIFSHLSA